jgi:hypothetical protein
MDVEVGLRQWSGRIGGQLAAQLFRNTKGVEGGGVRERRGGDQGRGADAAGGG